MILVDTRYVTQTVEKVTAFVTRGKGDARELLVFRHPTAGIQLPAGTVDLGETPQAAARREVWEETGLRDVTVVAKLASFVEEMDPDTRMFLTSPTFVRAMPKEDAPSLPLPLGNGSMAEFAVRGATCRHLRSDDNAYIVSQGFAKVGFDLWSIDQNCWTLRETTVGWAPLEALTTHVQRHLFHLQPSIDTADRWMYNGDVPGCELYWTPLTLYTGLVRPHQELLMRTIQQLHDTLAEDLLETRR